MKVYRRLNFTFVPWIRSIFEPADGGWSLLCHANTMQDCDNAIAHDKRSTSLYEYKVEADDGM